MTTSFTCTGADLHEVAAWASRAVPARPVSPVLAGLLLDAGDQLTVSAFDFDTRVTGSIAATTTEPGRLLVSARLLAAIAKTVNRNVNVTLVEDHGHIVVRCGRSEWEMPALPVEDYPKLPAVGDPVGEVEAEALRRALGRVLPAVGREATLPMLTGIKLEGDADRLTLVATDRFRLAATEIEWKAVGQPSGGLEVLVPASLLDAAARGIGSAETVTLSVTDGGFGLATDTHTVTGRLVAAEFPRWRGIVPPLSDRHATVDAAELAAALDQAQALVAAEAERQLQLAFDDGSVEVSAVGDERRARAAATVELVGDPIAVTLNAGYLRDAIGACGGERVRLHFGAGDRKPVVVVPPDDDGYRHVVMPVKNASGRATA